MNTSKHIAGLILLLLVFAAGLFVSLFYGGSEQVGWNNSSSMDYIFREIRLPKTITAVIAGCCLSVAGLILQVIFRNPLAGPYVLGISSGASLMVALTVLAGNSWWWMHELAQGKSLKILAAIAGSVAVTLLILAVSKKISSNVILLLVGLMFSQLCGALESALEYFADPGNLKSFVVWGMGSLGSTTLSDTRVFGGVALVTLLAVLMFVKPLNALLMGEQYARNLGISYSKSRFYLILLSSVLTGICTAFCGPIAFVGIAVPILSRMLFKSSNQLLHVITGMLLGSSILLFADAISHRLLGYATLPVNMITTFVGAPLVMYLMFKNKQW